MVILNHSKLLTWLLLISESNHCLLIGRASLPVDFTESADRIYTSCDPEDPRAYTEVYDRQADDAWQRTDAQRSANWQRPERYTLLFHEYMWVNMMDPLLFRGIDTSRKTCCRGRPRALNMNVGHIAG